MTNMPMDGLGMTSKLKNGGKRQMTRMDRVQYSGRMPMIRLLGNQKDQLVELRCTASKQSTSNKMNWVKCG